MTDEEPAAPGKGGEPSATPEEPSPEARTAPGEEDWATRFKYLFADFENYRRRTERERETMTRQVRAGMLRELLPILEGFQTAEQSLDHLPPSDPVRKGLEILDREWMTFLKHEGVQPVVTVGQPFRAEEAEAVGEAPASSGHPAGTIAEVVQQGYRFYGGLLRPAKVIVARDRPASSTAGSSVAPDRSSEES